MDEIKNHLLDYLKNNRMMMLSTASETGPWAATVFYVIDDLFNIYFMSAENTKHVQDIEKNEKVAVAIAHTDQQFYSQKVGVQILGVAKKLDPQSEEFKDGMKRLLTVVWGYDDEKLLELETVKSMTGTLIRFKPEVALFLDEHEYGLRTTKKVTF